MYLTKFLHTTNGRYLMSIILGFGLASLFRTVCKEKNCLIFKAPPVEQLDEKIYKYEDKCYTYKSNITKCDINKKSVNIA